MACLFLGLAGILALDNRPNMKELVVVGAGCLVAAAICHQRTYRSAFRERESGIELVETGANVSWVNFSRLAVGSVTCAPELVPPSSRKPVVVKGLGRLVAIAGEPGESSASLYVRLVTLFESKQEVELTGKLKGRYDSLLSKYGPNHVVASVETGQQPGRMSIRGRVVFAVFVVASAGAVGAWVPGASGAAAVIATVGFVVAAVLFVLQIREHAQFRQSGNSEHGIVISPDGLALRTKDLAGEMGWHELIALELLPSEHKPTKMRIRLAGVDILLQEQFALPIWYLKRKCVRAMQEAQQAGSQSQVAAALRSQRVPNTSSNPYAPPEDL